MKTTDLQRPVELALFQTQSGISVHQKEMWMEPNEPGEPENLPAGWTRLTAWQFVKFTVLPPEEFIPAMHASLDREEQQARDQLHRELSRIADRRAQILQLQHNPESDLPLPAPSTIDDDIPF